MYQFHRPSRRAVLTAAAVSYLCVVQVFVVAGHLLAATGSSLEPSAISIRDRSCGNTGLDLCEVLTVPADHGSAEIAETEEVVFGLHEASRDPEGTLVIAVGGPGFAGLDAASSYLDFLPQSLVSRYDIVFFDARGVGRSGRLVCRDAEAHEPDWASQAADGADDAMLERASTRWSADCLDEAGITIDDVDRFGTRQVVDDLEAYRRHRGIEQLVVYGESYGSLVAQLYAARYPAHTARIVIDGPVDPTMDGFAFAMESNRGFDAALDETMRACADDPICVDDFDGSPESAWTDLVDRFEGGLLQIEAAGEDGVVRPQTITIGELDQLAVATLYTTAERMLLQRALAAASHGDISRLAELMAAYGISRPVASPQHSAAAYLAIRCADYGRSTAAPISEIRAAAGAAEAAGELLPRDLWYELPCFAGFEPPDAEASALISPADATNDVPTLVLTATADPVTPPEMARRIADRLSNAHLVETDGGPHVTFPGYGPCSDDLVTDFILEGDVPSDKRTICDGYVTDLYVPVLRASVDAYDDVGEAMRAVEEELINLPAYFFWTGNGVRVPCRHGGTMALRPGAEADIFAFSNCELFLDWPMDGSATISFDGSTTIELTAPDTELEYLSDVDWTVTVSGTYNGAPIQIGE